MYITKHRWSYHNAFFFTGTLASTIGYGSITPQTTAGKYFCLVFITLGNRKYHSRIIKNIYFTHNFEVTGVTHIKYLKIQEFTEHLDKMILYCRYSILCLYDVVNFRFNQSLNGFAKTLYRTGTTPFAAILCYSISIFLYWVIACYCSSILYFYTYGR